MIIHETVEQGSDEWHELRLGKVTASMVSSLLVNGKSESGFGVGALTEMRRVVEERITRIKKESFAGNKATEWGHENEVLARQLYERTNFIKTKQVGFIERNEWVGFSPDSLVGEDGGLEIKCLPTNHAEIVDTGTYSGMSAHVQQCQFSMWVSQRKWWDLCFYHPNYPENIKMICFRQLPDLELYKKLDERVSAFIKECEKMQSRFLNK